MITKWIKFVDVEEEEEMEIGYPTDVRHVSHIGWDSSSSSAPSWVRHFFATIRNYGVCFLITTLMCSVLWISSFVLCFDVLRYQMSKKNRTWIDLG
jgi:hypothetical protein